MKKTDKKAEIYSSNLIDSLFNEISSDDFERTKNKMLLAARIDDAIKAKKWKKKDLAEALNKRPSEITKWLSGTHNFTVDTLWQLEKVLDIELIKLSGSKTEQVTNFYISVSQETVKESPDSIRINDTDQLIPYISTDIQA
jgi:transcriptional regulator with XRE-family HTH domain